MSKVAAYQESLKTLAAIRGKVKVVTKGLQEVGEKLEHPLLLMSRDGRLIEPLSGATGQEELEKLLSGYFQSIVAARAAYEAIPENEKAVVIEPPDQ